MSIQTMFTAEGMTLRDWFAGQVLAARLARPDTSPAEVQNGAELASWAYTVAKAMMAQREKLLAEEEQAMWDPEFAPPGPSTSTK
jgi:hypothetical protein